MKRFTAEFIGLNNLFDGRVAGVGGVQTVPASYVEQVYLGLTTSHLVNLPRLHT